MQYIRAIILYQHWAGGLDFSPKYFINEEYMLCTMRSSSSPGFWCRMTYYGASTHYTHPPWGHCRVHRKSGPILVLLFVVVSHEHSPWSFSARYIKKRKRNCSFLSSSCQLFVLTQNNYFLEMNEKNMYFFYKREMKEKNEQNKCTTGQNKNLEKLWK